MPPLKDSAAMTIQQAIQDNDIQKIITLPHSSENKVMITNLLYLSCINKHDEMVKILLEFGADPKCLYPWGKTVLHHAVSVVGNAVVLILLIEAGAPVNDRMQDDGRTPLHVACEQQDEDAVKILIEKRAGVNSEDDKRETPLVIACYHPSVAIIEALLKAGANPNYGSGKPLQIASRFGPCSEKIKCLLEHKADPTCLGSIMDILISCKDSLLLLSYYGFSVNKPNSLGQRPLGQVCHNIPCKTDFVKILLKAGARCDAFDRDGKTPFHTSCSQLNISSLIPMLDYGADVNQTIAVSGYRCCLTPIMMVATTTSCLTQFMPYRVMIVKFLWNAGATVLLSHYKRMKRYVRRVARRLNATMPGESQMLQAPEMLKFLHECVSVPRTLKDLCRLTIRCHLKYAASAKMQDCNGFRSMTQRIEDMLDLPRDLHTYLSLKDFISGYRLDQHVIVESDRVYMEVCDIDMTDADSDYE